MKKKFRLCFFACLLLFLPFLLMGAVIFFLMIRDLPSVESLKSYHPPQSSVVFDRYGNVVGRFFDERRTVIDVLKLPNFVKQAFIAAEDGDFYEHGGVDFNGLLRAIFLEVKYRIVGGRRVGGSTITQQTARTMFLSTKQTYMRKIKEIILAQRIEHALKKDEILNLYLNQIYFGNGAYGIEEAALTYFQKSANELTLFEAAALASIPKSPNRINPFADTNRLLARQHYVLDQMVKRNFIDNKDATEAKEAPLFSEVKEKGQKPLAPYFLSAVKKELSTKVRANVIFGGGLKIFSTIDINMQQSAQRALQNGLKNIDKRAGFRGPLFRPSSFENEKIEKALRAFKQKAFVSNKMDFAWDLSGMSKKAFHKGIDSFCDGLRLVNIKAGLALGARVVAINDRLNFATVDLGSINVRIPMSGLKWAKPYLNGQPTKNPTRPSDVLQVGDIVLVTLYEKGKKLFADLDQKPIVNGGLVAMDLKSGAVRALVGGYDYSKSSFNRITQAKRQPGSGIKPLIYALAIDRELVSAATIITDAPKVFFDPGTKEYWRPKNHTNKYLGDITVRKCLGSSINTCTLTILEKVGLDTFLKFAREVGINKQESPFQRNLTIALGSAEVFPIDLANALRILGNEGIFSHYHMINSLAYSDGEKEQIYEPSAYQLIRPESAFIVTQLLKQVIPDERKNLYLFNIESELAGKTGTTNDVRSAWFFGYSPEILTLVYVGYDDNRSIGSHEWGITTAFPIWASFMNEVLQDGETLTFNIPENIVWLRVDKNTGKPLPQDPLDNDAILTQGINEAFIAGTEPKSELSTDGSDRISPNIQFENAFAP